MSETKTFMKSTVRVAVAAKSVVAALALALLMASAAPVLAIPVDINAAGVAELSALPGIGKSKAEAIIEERERRRFESVEDLERVSGIGPKTLAQLREHITVQPEPVLE